MSEGDTMDVILVMCVGVLIGNRFFPKKYKKLNERLQVVCTIVLIFCMGVMLGHRENFLQELSSLGLQSFLFFFFPTLFSVILVYWLTCRFMNGKDKKNKRR